MIIFLRGNNGSGKSTAVKTVLQRCAATPVYGALGIKLPEAYRCSKALHILGPYDGPGWAGFDHITKLGVQAAASLLERYVALGDVLFESVFVSARLLGPSIGRVLDANRDKVIAATLTTTPEQCRVAIASRQTRSIVRPGSGRQFEKQQREMATVTRRLHEKGYRMEYVSREEAPGAILRWLREKR
jgi:hypothetical protein